MHDGKPFKSPIRPRTKKEQAAAEKRWKAQQTGKVHDYPKPPMTSAPEAQAGKGGVEKAAQKGAAYRFTKAVWGKDVAEKKKGATGVALLSHIAGGAALKAGQLAVRAVVKALPKAATASLSKRILKEAMGKTGKTSPPVDLLKKGLMPLPKGLFFKDKATGKVLTDPKKIQKAEQEFAKSYKRGNPDYDYNRRQLKAGTRTGNLPKGVLGKPKKKP